VGQLHFIGAGYKLAAIPETASCFPCKKISKEGNEKNCPPGNVIYFSEVHKGLVFSRFFTGMGKNRDIQYTVSSWQPVAGSHCKLPKTSCSNKMGYSK
jgi:hypothetical protein